MSRETKDPREYCVECGASDTLLERGDDGHLRCLRRKNRRTPASTSSAPDSLREIPPAAAPEREPVLSREQRERLQLDWRFGQTIQGDLVEALITSERSLWNRCAELERDARASLFSEDTKRLDWIEQNAVPVTRHAGGSVEWDGETWRYEGTYRTRGMKLGLREAIDAARAATPTSPEEPSR